MDKREAIEVMKAFASGHITAEVFWEKFKADETIKDILVKDEEKWEIPIALESGRTWSSWASHIHGSPMNFQSYRETEHLHWIVRKYIMRNHMPFKFGTFYTDRLMFLMDIQPSWLDIDDEEFLKNEIINKIPVDIATKKERINWCRNKIKECFRYDKSPPRWIQNAEWPIVNGKPLVFKRQSKERPDDEQVDFYFYDPDTKQETVVTQFY